LGVYLNTLKIKHIEAHMTTPDESKKPIKSSPPDDPAFVPLSASNKKLILGLVLVAVLGLVMVPVVIAVTAVITVKNNYDDTVETFQMEMDEELKKMEIIPTKNGTVEIRYKDNSEVTPKTTDEDSAKNDPAATPNDTRDVNAKASPDPTP
jgi:hypothetical protein